MRTVWKYNLPYNGKTLNLSPGARVVLVDTQNDALHLWIDHDPEIGGDIYDFVVIGTGHQILGHTWGHVGSSIQGGFVWHVYQKVRTISKERKDDSNL